MLIESGGLEATPNRKKGKIRVMSLLADVDIGRDFLIKDEVGIGKVEELQSIGGLLSSWLPNVYVVAGIILFFFILMGGFTMIMNAGNTEKTQQGQKVLTSAVVGFVLLFASYWIIQVIQIITGVPILGSEL